jgi:hypothetical protein
MTKLDQRGSAAFEFCVVGAALFILIFAIFDLGRFAITYQSLRALANASARATMVSCYSAKVTSGESPDVCTADYLTLEQKQVAAPFLYLGSSLPTVSTIADGTALVVTASMPSFAMIVDAYGTSLDAPSVSTKIPY